MVVGIPWTPPGHSRALQGAPGVLGGVFLEALEVSRGAFWMIFLALGDTGSENGEMLESDDRLNENAMFRGSQGPQNETKMAPEEQRRENRSKLAGWLVGWWLGWCLGWCLVVAWGRPGGGDCTVQPGTPPRRPGGDYRGGTET